MQGKFKELLMKKAKEGKMISPEKAKQKMSVLDELDDMMNGEMASKMKGLKKVTVAAKDSEGLEEGLEKAQEMIGEDEESEEESKDFSEMSKEELIEMLQASKSE